MNSASIHQLMSSIFPAQNNFGGTDYTEILSILPDFGIHTLEELEKLIHTHKAEVSAIDAQFILDKEEDYRSMYGDDFVNERLAHHFFFSYQGLIHIALEIAFPEAYQKRFGE